MRSLLCFVVFLSGPVSWKVIQAEEKPKMTQDIWEVVLIDSPAGEQKIGYTHFFVQEEKRNGKTILKATKELRLTVQRGRDIAEIKGDVGTEEQSDGLVVGVYMKQWLTERQINLMRGQLKDKEMHISVEGPVPNDRKLKWHPSIVGLVQEQTLLRDRKSKPGDQFSYPYFEPTATAVVKVNVHVQELEEVMIPGQGKQKLLRVEAKPEQLKGLQLPASIFWYDPVSYNLVRTQWELPGLGKLTLLRSTKAAAMAPNGKVPELFSTQSIRLANRIENVHRATGIKYRITLTDKEANPKGILQEDSRQHIENLQDRTFDLFVESKRRPQKMDKVEEISEDYKISNFFINSADKQVQKYAAEAVDDRKDPWEKAQAIERWVRANMKPVVYTQAMATADHVAKTLTGDCTEFAMLAAAMCRAQNIPSRTALGMVYYEDSRIGPVLAFHMWLEVYVHGQWLSLDPTLGQGSIGPGHVKISDHHWTDVRGFDPLLSVTRFILAKPLVEVVSVRRSER